MRNPHNNLNMLGKVKNKQQKLEQVKKLVSGSKIGNSNLYKCQKLYFPLMQCAAVKKCCSVISVAAQSWFQLFPSPVNPRLAIHGHTARESWLLPLA